MTHSDDNVLIWLADVSLLNNPVILRALVLALGLAYVLIAVIFGGILAADGRLEDLPKFLAAMSLGFGFVTLLIVLVMLIVFQNRMRVLFVLGDEGLSAFVADRRAQIAGALSGLAGGAAGNPTLIGAGLIRQGAQREFTAWRRVSGARFDPDRYRVTLVAKGWWPVGAIQCDAGSWAAVEARMRAIMAAEGIADLTAKSTT